MSVSGLIVGLGNPGRQYECTRHNMGFMLVDALLEAVGGEPERNGSKYNCKVWKVFLPGADGALHPWLAAEPQTFMNLSGEAVQPLAAWNRICPERILVIHDELDLAPGRMKFKKGGGDAGHNGLKSITARLGTPDYYRLRIGIGRSPFGGEVTGWVLGRLAPEELTRLRHMQTAALAAVKLFAGGDIVGAVRTVNGYTAQGM